MKCKYAQLDTKFKPVCDCIRAGFQCCGDQEEIMYLEEDKELMSEEEWEMYVNA
jgi:hypothetical protein